MPVTRGGAPVMSEANPGAVLAGKPTITSSANAPPAMSFARLGNFPSFKSFWVKAGTVPSQAKMMALVAGWLCTA
jgi:hypothetical protein